MNRLLQRQLKRSFGNEANIPPEIQSFVQAVERSYNHYEEDRKLLERAMNISSEELEETNKQLQDDVKEKNEILSGLRTSLKALSTIDVETSADKIDADIDIMDAVNLLNEQATRIVKMESELTFVNILLNHTNDSIQVSDETGRFIFVNEEFSKRLNLPKEKIQNMYIQDVEELFSNGTLKWEDHVEELKEKEQMLVEGVNVFADGTKVPVEVNVKYVSLDNKGYVMAVSRDITERKKTQQRLLKTNKRLTTVNKELENFAYVASHDLKAPLRGIGSITDWLINDHADTMNEDGAELLQLMKNNVQRMHNLIEGLLQYSRIGKINPIRENIDTGQLLREIQNRFKLLKLGRLILPKQLPSIINDRISIQQVFENLIYNAVKYNDHPAEEKKVEIGVKDLGSHHEFFVKDNGIGIEEKYYNRIFKIFQTLAQKKDAKGTGIGLAIVQKIIENNNGEIRLESTPGKGTTFYFTLKKKKLKPSSKNPIESTSKTINQVE